MCTDSLPALSVRDFITRPVALVVTDFTPAQEDAKTTWRLDTAHPHENLTRFHLGSNRLAVSVARESDRHDILKQLEAFTPFDFSEPFGRIREAIGEAHRAGK